MKLSINRKQILPWIICALIVLADQISKIIIISTLHIGEKIKVLGDFLWIWHVRNTAMAFNFLSEIPDPARGLIILILQSTMVALLVLAYIKLKYLSDFQRLCLAAAVGGGLGNLFDRIFPHEGIKGVVDFISVNVYGFLGFDRWPTFNVADSVLVIVLIILAISLVVQKKEAETPVQD